MKNVLIVEDEPIIAIEIEDIINNVGLKNTTRIHTKQATLDFINTNCVDIVLLDINLEDEFEGIDIARHIQINSPHTSIIFLTAYSDVTLLKAISEIHFAAYLIKPFRKPELEAIINLEKFKQERDTSRNIKLTNNYELNISKTLLIYKSENYHLTKKELMLLKLLSACHKYIISFTEIEIEVWNGSHVTENTRRNLIYKLNKKLPIPIIQTHVGVGYSIQK